MKRMNRNELINSVVVREGVTKWLESQNRDDDRTNYDMINDGLNSMIVVFFTDNAGDHNDYDRRMYNEVREICKELVKVFTVPTQVVNQFNDDELYFSFYFMTKSYFGVNDDVERMHCVFGSGVVTQSLKSKTVTLIFK